MEPQEPPNGRKEFGPVAGIVIILGLLVAGGLYFLLKQRQEAAPQQQPSDEALVEATGTLEAGL